MQKQDRFLIKLSLAVATIAAFFCKSFMCRLVMRSLEPVVFAKRRFSKIWRAREGWRILIGMCACYAVADCQTCLHELAVNRKVSNRRNVRCCSNWGDWYKQWRDGAAFKAIAGSLIRNNLSTSPTPIITTRNEMSQLQRVMVANGLLVMLVSIFAGFMLMFNLTGGFEI